MDENPGILSHISIGTNKFDITKNFYQKILTVLDIVIIEEFPGAVAFSKKYPEFWVQTPIDGKPATNSNGSHISFIAPSKKSVDAFHKVALEEGVTCEGGPGGRPDYGPQYYGAFIRDLDGHKIEAAFFR